MLKKNATCLVYLVLGEVTVRFFRGYAALLGMYLYEQSQFLLRPYLACFDLLIRTYIQHNVSLKLTRTGDKPAEI